MSSRPSPTSVIQPGANLLNCVARGLVIGDQNRLLEPFEGSFRRVEGDPADGPIEGRELRNPAQTSVQARSQRRFFTVTVLDPF